MWRSLTATVLIAASTAFAVAHATGRAAAKDEALTLDQINVEDHSAGRPWSIIRSNGQVCFQVRQGERRGQLRERDRPIERSELKLEKILRFGVDYRFSYDFMVAPGPLNTSSWVNIGQIHSSQDLLDANHLGPLFAVQLKGERMRIVARADPRLASPERPPDMWLYRDTADLVRGQWYRMDVRIRVAPQGGGLLVIRRDGQEIVNYRGPLGYNDAVGPYLKLGIYRHTSPSPMTACYRDFVLTEAEDGSQAGQ